MNTIKLVITSDNHLNRYYDRMAPQKLAQRRVHLRRGFHRAVEYALEHSVDLFIQAGDLFDTPDPRNVDREFVAHQLARLRQVGIPVLGIGGNHDTPKQRTEHGGAMPQGTYAQLGGLRLFEQLDGEVVQTDVLNIRDVHLSIGALPWSPARSMGCDPLEGVNWTPRGDVNVFLFHHSVEGHVYPAPNEAIVTKASLDRLRNTHLVIAGHVHHHATWQIGPLAVLIPGATERMTFGETGLPGFCVAELSPGGVEHIEHVRVEYQPRREVTVRTGGLHGNGEDLCASVLRRIEGVCAADALVRLHFEGPITRETYRTLDLRRIWEAGGQASFYFDVDTSGLVVQDEFGDRPVGGIRLSQREELAACADELLASTDDPDERELLEETKQELLAFYETGGPA